MDLVGQVIAQHRILAALGEGGMGDVYLAEHETIKRRVAIKVLHRRFLDDEETMARFFNEARAANRIRHSGIVDIYDVGVDPDVGAYLVMEHLEGETLAARVARQGRLPIAEAVGVVGAIAAVLDVAHAAGIVHRDLKPANIFLVRDDQSGAERVKVVDFGIAKLFGAASKVRTRTGELLGTPLYMSPEQCHGAKLVDHRTDIYALGVILYQLLCGRVPFDAEGFGELIAKHLAQAPPTMRAQRPEIPPAVERVVLRALAKDPQARQQSMVELQQELGAALVADQATLPSVTEAERPPTLPPTIKAEVRAKPVSKAAAPRRPRRRRWVLALLGAALLAGGGAAAYVQLFGEDAERACTPGDLADCQRQCDLGQPDSCLALARMFRGGKGAARSPERAATLLQRLCDGKLGAACRELGSMYASGEGVRQDIAQAAILLRRACDAGSKEACLDAGQMYRDGKGVARSPELAAQLLRRSCDGGALRGCLLLGELFAAAPAKDLSRARPLFARSCEKGLAQGCVLLAELSERPASGAPDHAGALSYYKRACALGHAAACEAERRVSVLVAETTKHSRVGWVYLGEHRGGAWRQRNFDIAPSARPEGLVGKTLRSLGPTNLRYGPPSDEGVIARAVGGIKRGAAVGLLVVQRWQQSSYVWARVRTLE